MAQTVFVAGAHGQVGAQLVETLLENDVHVIAGYRDLAQADTPTTAYTPVLFDLSQDIATLAKPLAGVDAVIFAAGSAGKQLLAVDLDGAVKLIEAAKVAGVTRYIQLSSLNASHRALWPASLNDYYIAKFYADAWLKNTALDYVIVEPTTLTNAEGTGNITLRPVAGSTIARTDVATVLAEVVDADLHRQTIQIASGSIPIAQAF